MKILRPAALVGSLVTALGPAAVAAPRLESPQAAGRLTVYADDRRPGLFDYGPGELLVARTDDGRPHVRLLQSVPVGVSDLRTCERHRAPQMVDTYGNYQNDPAGYAEVLDTIAHDIQRSVDHLALFQAPESEAAVPCPSIKTFASRIAALAGRRSVDAAGGY